MTIKLIIRLKEDPLLHLENCIEYIESEINERKSKIHKCEYERIYDEHGLFLSDSCTFCGHVFGQEKIIVKQTGEKDGI